MVDLIIVGAGFAGLVAAIKAARAGLSVCIMEHMDSAGKKIRLTGNGKCNIAPEKILLNGYHSSSLTYEVIEGFDYAFNKEILDRSTIYNPIATAFGDISITDEISFLRELGLDCHTYHGGYYPESERASSVLEVLLYEINRLGVEIKYDMAIRFITKDGDYFKLDTKSGSFSAKRVLIATGGKSYKNTGSDGSGHIYASKLGHKLVDMTPTLVPLVSPQSKKHNLGGIRVNSSLALFINGQKIITEFGQLQLTDYGISGICVFNLSSYISGLDLSENEVYITVDFAPDKNSGYLYLRLLELKQSVFTKDKTISEALLGMLHVNIIDAVADELGLDVSAPISSLSDYELEQFTYKLKAFRFDITDTKGFDMAQATSGGIDFSEVNTNTFESRIVKDLYFAGEVLDITGNCGGYNLLFAYYSASKAVFSMIND